MKRPYNSEQRPLNFNPIEIDPEQSATLRRRLWAEAKWDDDPDFQPLPCETLAEFFAAREIYWQQIETFGPLFPPVAFALPTSPANRQSRPPRRSAQLLLIE